MMTITEYKAGVQHKKSEMLASTDLAANSQKEIAFITIGESYDNFIQMARDIFEEFGFVVHWYHYKKEVANELDMGIEIADLRPHYAKVFVFDNEADWQYLKAAYEIAGQLVPQTGAESICVIGNDEYASYFAFEQLLKGKRIIAKPHGVGNVYSDVFECDVTFIFDRRGRLNCYPIYKPVFHMFSWNVINEEERQTYDMGEEIVLEVIKSVCG